MASWITLTGVKPYDGRYELDLDGQPLTMREWGWIKRHAGYLPVTLTGEAFTDPELITMLAIISMTRAGKITNGDVPDLWDRFQDVPVSARPSPSKPTRMMPWGMMPATPPGKKSEKQSPVGAVHRPGR